MKRAFRIALLVFLAVIVIIQVFQPSRDNPPVRAEVITPPEVKAVLRRSCYDCHSNETAWPWYSYINPMGWLVAGHVTEGREHLNFSDWENLDPKERYHAKEEILEMIAEDEMPLPSYLLLHSDAALSAEEKGVLTRWAKESQ